MKAYVGITDGDWYRFLAERRIVEVNFWRPAGGRRFAALQVGEPFFFKTHAPHNKVVGGGFYSGFSALRISEAWAFFGDGNGVASLNDMRSAVARYRREPLQPQDDPVIGCVFIRDVAFFDEAHAEPPTDFAPNLVQGRTYDLTDQATRLYFDLLFTRLLGHQVQLDSESPWHASGEIYGDSRLVPHRLGQRAFQAVVLGAYNYRCAVTGDRIRPVSKRPTFCPFPEAARTGSTMDCFCAPTFTPCSTVATWASTSSTAFR